MYHNILKMKNLDRNDDGYKYWEQELAKGAKRQDIEKYFRQVAMKDNKEKKMDFGSFLNKDDEGKRILFVMPQSAGDVFWTTSLFKSIKEMYPDYNLYYATKKEYMDVLEGNPYIYKTLEYSPVMDNLLWSEGAADHKGYFEITFLPFIGTQRMLNYLHNGKDKLAFNIKAF